MKKLYIILIAALLLTLAACLTACSAKPVSLRGTEAPNLPGPTNDALKVTDEGQDWNITLEQVDKENFAEDDRLLAKGSYQVFQLNQEGSGDTLTATAAAAEGINAYFEQWRKDQLQFLGDVTNLARDAYAGVNGEDSRWEQPEYVYSDTVTTDYWVGPELLCVEMHYSSYSGGAHPNSWRVAVSFDLNTGEAVKIMELAEDSEGLRAAVKENLLYQIRESDIWTEYGAEAFFEDYEDTVGNWADQCLVFDDNGLTVVFNPYTIAPYATGELSYLIPYSLLQPYLNGRAMQLLGLTESILWINKGLPPDRWKPFIMSLLQDGLGVHIKLPDRRCIGGDGLRLMVPLLDELGGYLGEQGQAQHILVGLGQTLELLAVLLQLRLQQIGGTTGDDILRGDARLGADLLVDLAGQLAVFTLEHGAGLLGERLVALAHDDVHHSLGAHDLGGGRYQRGIAEVLADAGDLC